jgi:GT2 family glycosyltransferase
MLKTILDCVLNSIIDKTFIVDNSPTDELKSFVLQYPSSKIEYIYGQGNVGYGAGHNIAIRKSIADEAKYHIVLNPDIKFEPNVIDSLRAFMDKYPNAGYVIPRTYGVDGKLRPICKRLPYPMDIFGSRFLQSRFAKKKTDKYHLSSINEDDEIRNVPILSGCFMFMRVETLKKVGLFDERYFMYFEDFDLLRRIHKVAWNVYYPKVSIIHEYNGEHKKDKKILKIGIVNGIRYFNKWGWFFDSYRKKVNRHIFDPENIIK